MAHQSLYEDHIPTTTILVYIRRKPGLTSEQFYDHWETVHARIVAPWAEKNGLLGYRQIHLAGTLPPTNTATQQSPHSTSTNTLHFDGIATFEVPADVQFADAFKDPYYTAVIEPDEARFIDKEGQGSGVLATFEGKTMTILDHGMSMLGEKGKGERTLWAEFEVKQRKKNEA